MHLQSRIADSLEEIKDTQIYRWDKYDAWYDWDFTYNDPADDWYLRWMYIKE